MKTLLAVIESEQMQAELRRELVPEFDLTFCADAESGGKLLRQKPEGLILDLYLPGTTGLTFLEQHRSLLPPVVLVLSPLATPYVLQTVSRLGAGFLIRTPCTTEEVARRLRDMFLLTKVPEAIRDHLLRLRVSPRLLGYLYLTEGIRLFAGNRQMLVSKELYPALARQFGTTADAVEHAVRACLRDAWEHRDPAVWESYFPGCARCPSNREFLAVLVEFA